MHSSLRRTVPILVTALVSSGSVGLVSAAGPDAATSQAAVASLPSAAAADIPTPEDYFGFPRR
jgi:hypothetical protein